MVDTLDASPETHHLIASDRVEGTRVYNRGGEKLGSIKNFMVGKISGHAEYAVIEFGGILGIGNDYYPIPWDMLTYDVEKGGYVVDLARDRLENAPRHGATYPEYDHNYGRHIFDYYGMAYPYTYPVI
ncbi:MAG: PRC-barrel domain-containing protein [Novosphingobium sp.]